MDEASNIIQLLTDTDQDIVHNCLIKPLQMIHELYTVIALLALLPSFNGECGDGAERASGVNALYFIICPNSFLQQGPD